MPISLRGLQGPVRQNAEWAMAVAARYGVKVTVTSVGRSWVQQAALYRRYQDCVRRGAFPTRGLCEYPANAPGDSSHQYGLAWDSQVEPIYRPWWAHVRRLAGFHVPQHDLIHAEVPNWRRFVA